MLNLVDQRSDSSTNLNTKLVSLLQAVVRVQSDSIRRSEEISMIATETTSVFILEEHQSDIDAAYPVRMIVPLFSVVP